MPDITLHLTANFYPPIPHDIQRSCQEFFDLIVEKAQPYVFEDDSGLFDESALELEWELPNGRIIKASHMLDELRLWEALWWGLEETLDHEPELQYAEERWEQLTLWEDSLD